MKRYLELSRQRDRLWLENQALQDAFEDREKVSFRFQRLFDVNYQLVRPCCAFCPLAAAPRLDRPVAPCLSALALGLTVALHCHFYCHRCCCRWITRWRRRPSRTCRCRRR